MYKDILETLKHILHNNGMRVCDNCKRIMIEGYIIEGGIKHYCSYDCLNTNISPKEYKRLHSEGDTYYIELGYCKEVLKAVNNLVKEAPVLQESENGIRPIYNNIIDK